MGHRSSLVVVLNNRTWHRSLSHYHSSYETPSIIHVYIACTCTPAFRVCRIQSRHMGTGSLRQGNVKQLHLKSVGCNQCQTWMSRIGAYSIFKLLAIGHTLCDVHFVTGGILCDRVYTCTL